MTEPAPHLRNLHRFRVGSSSERQHQFWIGLVSIIFFLAALSADVYETQQDQKVRSGRSFSNRKLGRA